MCNFYFRTNKSKTKIQLIHSEPSETTWSDLYPGAVERCGNSDVQRGSLRLSHTLVDGTC